MPLKQGGDEPPHEGVLHMFTRTITEGMGQRVCSFEIWRDDAKLPTPGLCQFTLAPSFPLPPPHCIFAGQLGGKSCSG